MLSVKRSEQLDSEPNKMKLGMRLRGKRFVKWGTKQELTSQSNHKQT
jgi:hypothetical protein